MAHPRYQYLVEQLFQNNSLEVNLLEQWDAFSSTDELFDLLCKIPGLNECFQKSAFVGEGYNILEHSKRVVQTATELRTQLESKLSVPWNEFILFLALHDIGKGVAREAIQSQSPNAINAFHDKTAELAVSRLIVKKIMSVCGVLSERQKIYSALLNQDLIGDYLTDNSHLEQAFHVCLQLAAEANMAPQQMFDMFVVFHQCDAASYPFLRERIFESQDGILHYCEKYRQKIESLQYDLDLVKKGEETYKELLSDMSQQVSPAEIKQKFDFSVPSLTAFLENIKTRLLASKSRSPNERSYFSGIRKGFRDVLINLYKVKDDNPNSSFENRAQSYIRDHELYVFDFQYKWDFVNFKEIFKAFRNDFHIRFSKSKILTKIKSGMRDSEAAMHLDHLDNVFFHGTNSALLVNLPLTDYYMIPTGRLISNGVTPLCGELGRGATLYGINTKKLSGVPLSDVKTAKRYSTYFKLDIQNLKDSFDKSIEQLSAQFDAASKKGGRLFTCEYELQNFNGEQLSNLAYRVLKIRTLQSLGQYYGEVELQNKFEKLRQLIGQYQLAFKRYKETSDYHWRMPKSEDKRFGGHDDCYKTDFEIYEHSLEAVLNALDSEICVPDAADLTFAEDAFPMVIAARKVHTEPHGESTEIFSNRPLRFGSDIKDIYVHEENRAQMEDWLVRHGLDSKMRIHDIKLLDVAYSYQKKLDSYLNDIVSEKKLNALVAANTKLVEPLPKVEPMQKPPFGIDSKQQTSRNFIFCGLNGICNLASYPKTKIEQIQTRIGIKHSDTQPVFKADSGAAAAYWAGRESQRSWLSYFKSYVSKDAYRLSSYYLGVYDEKYKVDSKIRFEPT